MKVLWICNVKIPKIYELNHENNRNFSGGWLSGISDSLLKMNNIELIYCYPNYTSKEVIELSEGNFHSYGIPLTTKEANLTLNKSSKAVKIFENICDTEKPNIVHFWGTEFLYSLEFFKVLKTKGNENICLVSIQGLVGFCALHYRADLPQNIFKRFTLSELKGHCSMKNVEKSFSFRGKKEKELLKNVKNVIGRTSWDECCVKLINPNIRYFKCNESLRSVFYEDVWDFTKCNKQQIFISQASYPLKGFHKLLQAVNLIKSDYPNIMIKVAGENIFNGNYIKGNSYGNYIKELIKKYKLEKNVIFLGPINADKLKETLLESNLFICSSSIENSSNSLGEAMLLGLPCIASNVGGNGDMLENNKEGYLYPFTETYKLAYYIKKMFDNPVNATELGKNAKLKASLTHDRDININSLLSIYKEVLK